MIPSKEQSIIIDLIDVSNVIVDCSAGSGKTTCVIFIAEKYKNKNILLLTYNAQLKNETRKRTKLLKNLEVHSYHSFCTTYYDKDAHTDDIINKLLEENKQKIENSKKIVYDIIILDESQDITPLFYRLLKKIFTENGKNFKLLILGDKMQSIYKFKDSDHRFMTLGKELFSFYNNFEWNYTTLSETFRCTVHMVNFLNNCILGYERVISNKVSAVKPDYIICNTFGKYPKDIIKNYLKIYKPGDIFVLSSSNKNNNSPIKILANYVTSNLEVPIYYSNSDEECLDQRVIEGKIVFTTIHQSKGRERKVVILFGFDNSFFEYYAKNSNTNVCPNELYVALTRSSERLTIFHNYEKDFLPFVNETLIKNFTNFEIEKNYKNCKNKKEKQKQKENCKNKLILSVSDLIGYLPFSIENLCSNYINVKVINEKKEYLNVPAVIKIDGLYESVSNINGLAFPIYFEHTIKKCFTNKNLIEKNLINLINNENAESELIKKEIKKLTKLSKISSEFYNKNIKYLENVDTINSEETLKISLYYSFQKQKTDYLLKQITKFDWLEECVLLKGYERLKNVINNYENLYFEESVEKFFNDVLIFGEIDCIDRKNKIVYEFKCTKTLTTSHILQLVIYNFLNCKKDYEYKLYNIFTDELLEVKVDYEQIIKIIKILVENKIYMYNELNDEDFIKSYC